MSQTKCPTCGGRTVRIGGEDVCPRCPLPIELTDAPLIVDAYAPTDRLRVPVRNPLPDAARSAPGAAELLAVLVAADWLRQLIHEYRTDHDPETCGCGWCAWVGREDATDFYSFDPVEVAELLTTLSRVCEMTGGMIRSLLPGRLALDVEAATLSGSRT